MWATKSSRCSVNVVLLSETRRGEMLRERLDLRSDTFFGPARRGAAMRKRKPSASVLKREALQPEHREAGA